MIVQNVRTAVLPVLLLLCTCLSVNCQSPPDVEKVLSELDNGKVTANVYENKRLGLRIQFPTSMKTDPPESVAKDLKDGLELLKSEKPADRRLFEEMIRKDRIVFTLDLPEGEDSIGAALSLTIKKDESNEPIGPMIDRTIQFFTSNGRQKVAEPVREIQLSNLTFKTFSLSMAVEGGTVSSKLFVGRRNGYLLTFSIAYSDGKGLSEMEAVLKGIELF